MRFPTIGPQARADLIKATPIVHGLAHLAPLGLYALALAKPETIHALSAIAGLCAVAGGAWWKFVVITRACHQQGFALPMVPQRGSGQRAAPARYALN